MSNQILLDAVLRRSFLHFLIKILNTINPRDAPWLAAYEAEPLGFPGKNDDQVDSTTQYLLWAHEREIDGGFTYTFGSGDPVMDAIVEAQLAPGFRFG